MKQHDQIQIVATTKFKRRMIRCLVQNGDHIEHLHCIVLELLSLFYFVIVYLLNCFPELIIFYRKGRNIFVVTFTSLMIADVKSSNNTAREKCHTMFFFYHEALHTSRK